MKTNLLLGCTLLLIQACTSQPSVRYKTPNIHGQIIVNDAPASGIAIYLSQHGADKLCEQFVQRTRSDDQGNFKLTAEKENLDYTPLMTHYLDEWIICADVNGVRHKLYDNNRYGMGSVAPSLSLSCHISDHSSNNQPCQRASDH